MPLNWHGERRLVWHRTGTASDAGYIGMIFTHIKLFFNIIPARCKNYVPYRCCVRRVHADETNARSRALESQWIAVNSFWYSRDEINVSQLIWSHESVYTWPFRRTRVCDGMGEQNYTNKNKQYFIECVYARVCVYSQPCSTYRNVYTRTMQYTRNIQANGKVVFFSLERLTRSWKKN